MQKYRFSAAGAAWQNGFTLTELLVTMAILVILVGIGAPQLHQFIVQRTVVSQADTFASAMRLARSEAIKRGQNVSVCASTAPDAATPVCATDGPSVDWAQGWLVWVDDGANAKQFDSGEVVLKVQQAFTSSGGIKAQGASGQATVTFRPNGMVGPFDNAKFRIMPKLSGDQADDANYNRCVSLSTSGRTQIAKGICS